MCVYAMSMGNLEIHTAYSETINVLDFRQIKLGNKDSTAGI